LTLLCLVSPESRADWRGDVQRELEAQGFEGVRTFHDGTAAVLKYENRVFRYEMKALGFAASVGTRGLPDETRLKIVPANRGIAILEVSASAGDWNAFLKGSLTAREFQTRVRVRQPGADDLPDLESGPPPSETGSSQWKADFGIRPLAEIQLGIADNPFEAGLWLAPEVTMSPLPGALLTGQVIIKLRDEFDAFARDVAPGRTTLSFWGRLPGSIAAVASAGYFPGNRYGIAWEAGRFIGNGWLELRLAGDYSGFLKFSRGDRVLYSDLKAWSGLGSAILRSPSIDVELNVTGGRFIHGDRGGRVDLLRHFGEADFGFFAIKTNEGAVGGFRINVPLPVERQLRPARFRPVMVPSFPFEYREDQEPTGKRVRIFDNLDRFRKGLTPMFFLNNLDDLRSIPGGEE
jgi:hypothetical protein